MFYAQSTGGFYDTAIHGESIPADAVEITAAEHAALLAAQSTGKAIEADAEGRPVAVDPPPPTPEQMQASMTALMQGYLDDTARQRGYDGILSLCSYAGSANPQFSAEAVAGIAFRDAVWAYGYQVLADVQAGRRLIPSADELLAELPVIEWPEVAP
jgi:hypothetical protein